MKLTLLQLSMGVGGESLRFAPHVWKAILPLRLLGVPYETEFVVSAQLEEELPRRFGLRKITIPVSGPTAVFPQQSKCGGITGIDDDNADVKSYVWQRSRTNPGTVGQTLIVADGDCSNVIVDSYDIALFLEKHFSTPTLSIFSTAGNASPPDVVAGQAFARFIELWVDKAMAAELRPCTIHAGYDQFPNEGARHDPKSKARFLAKVGPEQMQLLRERNADPVWCNEQYERARKQLSLVDTLLRERFERGEAGSFLAGVRATQADFAVFAFYAYSLVNADLVRNTWKHDSLPFVGRWLEAMLSSGLVSSDELLKY